MLTSAALIVSVVAPFAIWAAPWPWAWRLALAIAAFDLIAWRLALPPGFGHGVFGVNATVVWAQVFAAVALISLGARAVSARLSVDPAPAPRMARRADIALSLALGPALALGFMGALARRFQGAENVTTLHVLTGAGALGLIALAALVPTVLARLTLAVTGLGVLAIAIWSYALHPAAVLSAAETATKGARWCLWLEHRDRPATARADLTFLSMDKTAPRDRHRTPHATLLMEDGTTLEWSYHLRDFPADTRRNQRPACDATAPNPLLD